MVQSYGPLVGADLTLLTAGTGTSNDEGGLFQLGTTVSGPDGTEFIYVHASAAITQYDFVVIDEDFECTPITDTTGNPDVGWMIGVAQVAFSDNDFGWVALKGTNIRGNVGESCAADTTLYTNANGPAGTLFTLTSGLTMIDGVVIREAQGGTSDTADVEVIISSYMHAGNVI